MGKSSRKTVNVGAQANGKPHETKKKRQALEKQSSSLTPPSKMTTYTVPPSNWPSGIPYLSVCIIPSTLDATQQSLLRPETLPPLTLYSIPALLTYSPSSNPLVQIRSITEPSHPAYPQSGLFAAKDLLPGTHIIDYTGDLHVCPLPSCATSDYDLAFLDRDASLAIDGSKMGNEGRFVNDWHGVRPDGPNAVFEEYYVKTRGAKSGKELWEARMGVWVAPAQDGPRGITQHGIKKGSEICVSYGRGWWRARRGVMEAQDGADDDYTWPQ